MPRNSKVDRLAQLINRLDNRIKEIEEGPQIRENTIRNLFNPLDEQLRHIDNISIEYYDPSIQIWGNDTSPALHQAQVTNWSSLPKLPWQIDTSGNVAKLARANTTFVRTSNAYDPDNGTLVNSGVPRYVRGKGFNMLTANQSSVETDTSGFSWSGNSPGAFLRITNESFFGNASLYVSTPAISGEGIRTDRSSNNYKIFARASTTYTASLYVKGNYGGETLDVALQTFDRNTNILGQSAIRITLSTAWTRYQVTHVTPSQADHMSLRIANSFAVAQVFYIDGLQVEEGSTPTDWKLGKTSEGVLIERQTTNILPTNSQNFTTSWTTFEGSSVVVTPTQLDPFGGTNAYRIQTTGGTSILKYYVSAGVSVNGTKYSTSVWVRNRSVNDLQVGQNAGGGPAYVIVSRNDGWRKLNIDNVTGNGVAVLQLQFRSTNSLLNLDFDAIWPQIEVGQSSTSFIDPQTTRNAETLNVNTQTINVTQGTLRIIAKPTKNWSATNRVNETIFRARNPVSSLQHVMHIYMDTGTNNLEFRMYNESPLTTVATHTLSLAGRNDTNPIDITVTWTSEGIRYFVDGVKYVDNFSYWDVPSPIPFIYIGAIEANNSTFNGSIELFHTEDISLSDETVLARFSTSAQVNSTPTTRSLCKFEQTLDSDYPNGVTFAIEGINLGGAPITNFEVAKGTLIYDGASNRFALIDSSATSEDGERYGPNEPAVVDAITNDGNGLVSSPTVYNLPNGQDSSTLTPIRWTLIPHISEPFWSVTVSLWTDNPFLTPTLKKLILEGTYKTAVTPETNWRWGYGGKWNG